MKSGRLSQFQTNTNKKTYNNAWMNQNKYKGDYKRISITHTIFST